MSKKIIALIISGIMAVSLIGCGNKDKKNSSDKGKSFSASSEEKYKDLNGDWTESVTIDKFESKYKELLSKVEEKTKSYGLQYSKEESVKEEKDETVSKKYIYLDNEKAEKNRLESLYYGIKLFGDDLKTGQITLKISLNFDGEGAVKNGDFDFGKTSIASYAELMTGEKGRDYSKINSEIINILKSTDGEGVYSNSIDGLYEEYTVNKDYIVYTLETKVIKFEAPDGAATKSEDTNK